MRRLSPHDISPPLGGAERRRVRSIEPKGDGSDQSSRKADGSDQGLLQGGIMGFIQSRLTLCILFLSLSFAFKASADLAQGSCTSHQPATVTTTQMASVGGKQLTVISSVGYLEVTASDGKSKACIFYTAYTVAPTGNEVRPITFAFNGGPGSASLWLNMGLVAPQRVDMGAEGLTVSHPFRLINNESSPIDTSDFVMIDPVATGFSASEEDSNADKFFGVKNDYLSVAQFIRNYLDANNRWASPKYVMGESYGGIRGSLLAHHLQSDMGIYLNGVIFVSPWLSTTTTNFGETGNDLPYVCYLPTYATTAHYQKRAAASFQGLDPITVLAKAQVFARGPYWQALQAGNDLSDDDFHAIAAQVSAFTGIPQNTVEDLNLRISDSDFFVDLLQSQNKVVGRFDSRFVGGRLPGQTGATATDPSDSATSGPFTAAVNFYLLSTLKFLSPSPYITSANIPTWPMEADGQEYGVMDDLSQALIDNPQLRIYVASGIYDLAVPYETVQYNFAHLAPRLNLAGRVTVKTFPSGHMVYTNPAALTSLKADLVQFIR